MPELPEVEVLVHHLRPLVQNRRIKRVSVVRRKVLRSTSETELKHALEGATILDIQRRGKYLVFSCRARPELQPFLVLGHLGMTGRMFLLPEGRVLPRHVAVTLDLGGEMFIFQDPRIFGRFTLEAACLRSLGPEPLSDEWTAHELWRELKRSRQPVKTRLLDQRTVAGIGNIYASEALFRAGISPGMAANRVSLALAIRLWTAIRAVLTEAINMGSTIPLNFSGAGERNGLFYYGTASGPQTSHERLLVYDRAGQPCVACGAKIKRVIHAARSTFYCPRCQHR